MQLDDVVTNADLAEDFQIQRSVQGQFTSTGWSDQKTMIPAWGVVSVASGKDMQSLPQADYVNEVRVFHCEQPIYVTRASGPGVSDILVWNGVQYRVLADAEYQNRGGYYRALATRMLGN